MKLALAAALSLGAAGAVAAERAPVERLVGVLHLEQAANEAVEARTDDARKRMVGDCRKRGGDTAACEAGVARMLVPMRKAFTQAFGWEATREATISLFSANLSDAEVDAALAYYGSPAGQALIDKLPQFARLANEQGERRLQALRPATEAELKALARALDAEEAARAQAAAQ
jgi:hypothetical protein